MNMRLAYRIASMKPQLPLELLSVADYDQQALTSRLADEAAMVRNSQNFDFSNIANFYAAHPQSEWCLIEDIPNWAPPFRRFFVEWNQPTQWDFGNGLVQVHEESVGQMGHMCIVSDVTDDTRNKIDYWCDLINRFAGIRAVISPNDDEFLRHLRLARWLIMTSEWMALRAKPMCGVPIWPDIHRFFFVGETGKLLGFFTSGAGIHASFFNRTSNSLSAILGLGLSFCHCKNVRHVECQSDMGDRWHKHNKTPRIKFHVLEINPMREVLRSEGGSETTGLKRALHICRGHFATYTEDHPLFGKYVGTFWRPDHVRGSKEQGEVNKRYSVNPKPSQETQGGQQG